MYYQFLSYQRRQPKLSDLELICLSLTAKFIGIDSENDLFRKLPKIISSKIDRSVYVRRRRRLINYSYDIRLKLASHYNGFKDYFIMDCMPLKICKLSRSSCSKACMEDTYVFLGKGYCASQSSNYHGYKLHAVCSLKCVFQSIDLSPVSVHDVNYFKDIKVQISDRILISRGYLST